MNELYHNGSSGSEFMIFGIAVMEIFGVNNGSGLFVEVKSSTPSKMQNYLDRASVYELQELSICLRNFSLKTTY